MTELLSGMRVIKFFGWEQVLEARVEAWRAQELGRLRVIKYLDAACVYLWAALPVVISIVIFITYVLLGNQLTATKVRTGGWGQGGWLEGGSSKKTAVEWGGASAGGTGWEGGRRIPGCLFCSNPGEFSEGTVCWGLRYVTLPSVKEFLFSSPLPFQLLVRPKLC